MTQLAQMSESWLQQVREAALLGYEDRLITLAQQLPATFAMLRSALIHRAQNYNFQTILDLVHQALTDTP
jgi:hypothetical protein